jgi:hypothetical protein
MWDVAGTLPRELRQICGGSSRSASASTSTVPRDLRQRAGLLRASGRAALRARGPPARGRIGRAAEEAGKSLDVADIVVSRLSPNLRTARSSSMRRRNGLMGASPSAGWLAAWLL